MISADWVLSVVFGAKEQGLATLLFLSLSALYSLEGLSEFGVFLGELGDFLVHDGVVA